MALRPHRSAARIQPGRNSLPRTWQSSLERFLHYKSADVARVGHILRLFFLHLKTRRVSIADITRGAGWSRWRGTRSTKPPDTYANIDTCCMIGTRSSALHSERCWQPVTSGVLRYHRAAESERLRRTVGRICRSGNASQDSSFLGRLTPASMTDAITRAKAWQSGHLIPLENPSAVVDAIRHVAFGARRTQVALSNTETLATSLARGSRSLLSARRARAGPSCIGGIGASSGRMSPRRTSITGWRGTSSSIRVR